MDQELNKELANQLLVMPGEARGVVFKTDGEYIIKTEGEDGLKKLEKELIALGCPIDYKKIQTLSYYPIGLRIISLLAIKKVFSYDDNKIKELGLFASRTSLILKLFINYFLDPEKVFFKDAAKIWHKHYSVGDMIPFKLDQVKKIGIVQIKNYQFHPVFCLYLGSYLCGFFQLLVKTNDITSEETKCPFRGDEYHEYLIKWK